MKEKILKLIQLAFEAGERYGVENSPVEKANPYHPDLREWLTYNGLAKEKEIINMYESSLLIEEIAHFIQKL